MKTRSLSIGMLIGVIIGVIIGYFIYPSQELQKKSNSDSIVMMIVNEVGPSSCYLTINNKGVVVKELFTDNSSLDACEQTLNNKLVPFLMRSQIKEFTFIRVDPTDGKIKEFREMKRKGVMI